MNLRLDKKIVGGYQSLSQRARILTEAWVDIQVFCPNCGHRNIDKYPNNQPVADFYCVNCHEDYELKSKQNTLGTKIVDGAYRTMLERLASISNPNFFLLNYDLENFEEELREVLEGHLYGLDEIAQIEFFGISFTLGQKGVVSLTPKISPDLLHCQESLFQLLKENGAHFSKSKNTTNTFLPIARCDSAEHLENAIEIAKVEFSSPFVLEGESFILFEKRPQLWVPKTNLYDLKSQDHFFLVNEL